MLILPKLEGFWRILRHEKRVGFTIIMAIRPADCYRHRFAFGIFQNGSEGLQLCTHDSVIHSSDPQQCGRHQMAAQDGGEKQPACRVTLQKGCKQSQSQKHRWNDEKE